MPHPLFEARQRYKANAVTGVRMDPSLLFGNRRGTTLNISKHSNHSKAGSGRPEPGSARREGSGDYLSMWTTDKFWIIDSIVMYLSDWFVLLSIPVSRLFSFESDLGYRTVIPGYRQIRLKHQRTIDIRRYIQYRPGNLNKMYYLFATPRQFFLTSIYDIFNLYVLHHRYTVYSCMKNMLSFHCRG